MGFRVSLLMATVFVLILLCMHIMEWHLVVRIGVAASWLLLWVLAIFLDQFGDQLKDG